MVEIVAGREEKKEQPRLALIQNGETKFYGSPGSVPKSVSRKHCKIVLNDDSTMSVTDITDNNFMFINGAECKSRGHVTVHDTVELGPDHYKLNIAAIMQACAANQEYHIGHLEKVYEDFNDFKMSNQVTQGKLNALSSIPGVLSMSSIGLACVLDGERFGKTRGVVVAVAAICAIVFFVLRYKKAEGNPLKMKEKENEFHDEYVCPNPMCQRFLGSQTYRDLRKLSNCPYCKARWIE